MKISRTTTRKEGSCNFCNRSTLGEGPEPYLSYPYTEVWVITGNVIRITMCDDCAKELTEFMQDMPAIKEAVK